MVEQGLKNKAMLRPREKLILLAETDWMVIRSHTAIDAAVLDAVRTASGTIESAINSAADLDAFKLLYKAPTDKGVVGKAPIDNDRRHHVFIFINCRSNCLFLRQIIAEPMS